MVQLCPDDDGEFCVVLEIFLNEDTILFFPVVTTIPGFILPATFVPESEYSGLSVLVASAFT